jgi:type I restriction-modification system DNA methylase subunit
VPHTTDLDVTPKEVVELASADALTAFLGKLGYDTADRALLSPEAVGLSGESASAIKRIELLSEDPEQFLRVVFAQPKSLTAKVRNDLVRVLGRSNRDHLLVLASDFDTLELVFLDKRKREQKGPAASERIQVVPKTISVNRRNPTRLDLRTLRRFTWTGRDALEQFDKLRSVFDAAAYTGEYVQNRGLFSDYFLRDRLREDPAWRENPAELFAIVRDLLRDAQNRWSGKDKETLRNQLFEPIFPKLGFKPTVNRPSKTDQTQPDYLLMAGDGGKRTAAFVYAWDRWLDGPDLNDTDTPEENPGACVVTPLDQGIADWIIVTNGRLWRLYSGQAHARSTNFYEVDLVEALTASGDTDPNEAFRYWSLFFRPAAFRPRADGAGCWLDTILQGSRDYVKRLGERLKDRNFLTIFPHLAQGFLMDRKQRLTSRERERADTPTEEELADIFEATLTLLYRLLFLLYAEGRDLLPIREAPYHAASLKKIKEEIAEKAGAAESAAADALQKTYSAKETTLYDRLCQLFRAMDKGDPILNVSTYNGGLFNTMPDQSERRDQRIARFLLEHKVPDRPLALAIDRLARDRDERTLALVFIDYKSLEVRHLGSIYEGLLEFKLKVAEEDLTTQADKKGETYIPLSKAKASGRCKPAGVVVSKGQVYLSNDKAERKASGSYYTPDPIVEYIVANTVGPVLEQKLEALRPQFRKVRKTFDNELQKAKAYPSKEIESGNMDHRQWAGLQTYNAHKNLVELLFDLRVLDPAMGSGHFLVQTVDFVTDHLLKFLNQFPINPVNFALDRTRTSILESLGEQGVTVDPAKLTDINLLKRHVLKRCIYGVDLNPMAVELAKVSLWLDAFTLGAPLNFLDHHLRCGNSLIGATFADLEEATKGEMFKLPLGPLLRAINHVLFVSRMADATAAEVAESASEYDQARQRLEGYRIVLDVLVARHFALPQAAHAVLAHPGLDFNSHDKFLESLGGDKERRLVAQVEALAVRPDRRFFHWEIEFPEVFFGFVDADHRQIKHKDKIEDGSAGFDCVVGNPPYDELSEHAAGRELPEKQYLKQTPLYKDAMGGRLNVFRPFILRSLSTLRSGGRHSFIVPMALLADQFTSALRRRLLTEGWLRSIAAFPQKDDPHNRVFFEAKLSTCIYVAEKQHKPDVEISIETYPGKSFADQAKKCAVTLAELKLLEPNGLSLPTIEQADIERWKRIATYSRVTSFRQVASCYLGEIMFNATNEDLISQKQVGPRIFRGGNVNRYQLLDEAKQGDVVFLHYERYLKKYANDARINHHKLERIAFQEAAPIDNWRRLIAAYMPAERICGHTLRYFSTDARYDLYAVLACFASALCEWRFGLTSTNNHVNAYEVDVLPIPRFSRLSAENTKPSRVDWRRWESILGNQEAGVEKWEQTVLAEIQKNLGDSDSWPDSIHDALAAAGKEMSHLGEERLSLTNDFANRLVETFQIDEPRFTGMTYIRGAQASFDQMGWEWFRDLLRRNRRCCGLDPTAKEQIVKHQHEEVASELARNRNRFSALDAAIDRTVWRLVGLEPDGTIPQQSVVGGEDSGRPGS